jgi:hypothetical protein
MRSTVIASAAAFTAVTLVVAVGTAEAQPRKRTHITVTPRSYLDPGTEVLPMSRSYTDYAVPPRYNPHVAFDPANERRSPLPETWYLPGYTRGW